MGNDPFSFSQFKRQKELDKLKKKGRGEGSSQDLTPPSDGKKRKIYRPSISKAPDNRKRR